MVIFRYLNLDLNETSNKIFADVVLNLHIIKIVLGDKVFVIQTGSYPVNDHIMELYLLLQTLKLSSAKEVSIVIPYFPYCRQDRKTKPRVPISSAAVAQLLETMNPNHILTLDLHCGQIQGFFTKTPVDNLYTDTLFVKYLKENNYHKYEDLVIVSPDAGGIARARRIADKLGGFPVITIMKRRSEANKVDTMDILGDVKNKRCVIVDDIVDTSGTLCKAVDLLKERGCINVEACITHGILSDPAMERINNNETLSKMIVTNSIPQDKNVARCSKLQVLDIAPLFSEAIRRIYNNDSLSELFSVVESPQTNTKIHNEEILNYLADNDKSQENIIKNSNLVGDNETSL